MFRGGKKPVTGAHCTIDNPEPVRRVTPPKHIIANITAHIEKSHIAIDLLGTIDERIEGLVRVFNKPRLTGFYQAFNPGITIKAYILRSYQRSAYNKVIMPRT